MAKGIRSIRGFSDILPEQTPLWQFVESNIQTTLEAYGYREIRLPIVEKTELFSRSIGEVTDIVEKEMYTFEDRNGDSLTLRPEGTAGCVRCGIQNGLFHGGQPRVWYAGPMFRHERPQKGRYRQFHQIGAEVYGESGPGVDAEMILMTARLLRRLGLEDVRLELNTLGTGEARAAHRAALVEYLQAHEDRLDDDARRRLHSNPLRILDTKNPDMQALVEQAPRLMDYLDEDSRSHFQAVCRVLDQAGVAYRVNPRLVRGLDYYSRTVFEWITDRLGAQGTVLAGGRYDALVEQIGGKPTPAIGFALGLERLVSLLEESGIRGPQSGPHAFVVSADSLRALPLVEGLRDRLPGLRLQMQTEGGSFRSQFKRADRSGAALALVLGEEELAEGRFGVKDLRGDAEQQRLDPEALSDYLARRWPELAATEVTD
ncbi:histidine--tRNA ligase [Alkalilimnicola ehrlichii]|uniref:histidine--tRNA ligase n=1 Tax=Alkalilimnicola ehrlichii TaxID=351052 RepID=UPI003BA14DD0